MTEESMRSRVEGHLSAILQPLTDEVASLELQRQEKVKEQAEVRQRMREEIEEIDGAIRGARNVLSAAERALNPKPRVAARGSRMTASGKRRNSSEAMRERIVQIMRDHPTLTYTVQELTEAIGSHKSSVQYAVGDLRDEGRIRLLGRRPKEPDEKGPPMNHYKLMPEELSANGDEP